MKSHIETMAGEKYISVFDVQIALHQIPIVGEEKETAASVTSKVKWVFNHLPFGSASSPFSRVMALNFSHFGPKSDLLVYMDDLIACSSWKSHLGPLDEDMFKARQVADLTLEPPKVQNGPNEVKYLGTHYQGRDQGGRRPYESHTGRAQTDQHQAAALIARHDRFREEIRAKFGESHGTLG